MPQPAIFQFAREQGNRAIAQFDNLRLEEVIGRRVSTQIAASLEGRGRVLVRPSGTEPVVRVLAEAERPEEAENLCASIASLVRQEAGSR